MKCELKGSVNIKIKYGQTVKLYQVLYVPQAEKNNLNVSMLVSKGATMGATQDKMIIKNNGVSINLDAGKGQKKSMMFYLKAKRYAQEGQEEHTNLTEKKMETSDEKEKWRNKLGLSSDIDINIGLQRSINATSMLR